MAIDCLTNRFQNCNCVAFAKPAVLGAAALIVASVIAPTIFAGYAAYVQGAALVAAVALLSTLDFPQFFRETTNEQSVRSTPIHQHPIVKPFLESIKERDFDLAVFIKVVKKDGSSHTAKYSHTIDAASAQALVCAGTNNSCIVFQIQDIQSIEVWPKIGYLVSQEDKDALANIGITFDEEHFITIPSDKYTSKTSVYLSQNQVTISSRSTGKEVAFINAKLVCHNPDAVVTIKSAVTH